MQELFLKELIKREREFKEHIRGLLKDLLKEIEIINSNKYLRKSGFNKTKPLFDYIHHSKALLLNDDYDDINNLCILVDNALRKDKRMYGENEVETINSLYEKTLKRYDENINYLKELLS